MSPPCGFSLLSTSTICYLCGLSVGRGRCRALCSLLPPQDGANCAMMEVFPPHWRRQRRSLEPWTPRARAQCARTWRHCGARDRNRGLGLISLLWRRGAHSWEGHLTLASWFSWRSLFGRGSPPGWTGIFQARHQLPKSDYLSGSTWHAHT